VSAGNPESGESYDVIPSLIDLLAEAMAGVGDRRGIKRAHHDVGGLISRNERTVRGYLDGKRSPVAKELDALVAAVAAEANTDRLELWQRAVDQARASVKQIGLDPRQEAVEAARAARPEESG
jgi:hypothetical protein